MVISSNCTFTWMKDTSTTSQSTQTSCVEKSLTSNRLITRRDRLWSLNSTLTGGMETIRVSEELIDSWSKVSSQSAYHHIFFLSQRVSFLFERDFIPSLFHVSLPLYSHVRPKFLDPKSPFTLLVSSASLQDKRDDDVEDDISVSVGDILAQIDFDKKSGDTKRREVLNRNLEQEGRSSRASDVPVFVILSLLSVKEVLDVVVAFLDMHVSLSLWIDEAESSDRPLSRTQTRTCLFFRVFGCVVHAALFTHGLGRENAEDEVGDVEQRRLCCSSCKTNTREGNERQDYERWGRKNNLRMSNSIIMLCPKKKPLIFKLDKHKWQLHL